MGTAPANEVPKFGADRANDAGAQSQVALRAQLEALRQAAPTPEARQEVQRRLDQLDQQEDIVTGVSAKQRNDLARRILLDRESQGPRQNAA